MLNGNLSVVRIGIFCVTTRGAPTPSLFDLFQNAMDDARLAWNTTPTLGGRIVTLRPLQSDDAPALWEAGSSPELWSLSPRKMTSLADMVTYVGEAVRLAENHRALPFVITESATGKPIGSTRFGNLDKTNRRVEIGWTWLAANWHGSGANAEAKLLLLGYAFGVMNCIRVELKTDVLNVQSRRAIERLGAQQEGILRSHVITAGGRRRDTVYYSILDAEWPDIRKTLEERVLRAV